MKEKKEMHPDAEKLGRLTVGCLVIIIPIVILFWIFSPIEEEKTLEVDKKEYKIPAIMEAREIIKKQLKSPSTANFPFGVGGEVYQLNDTTYKINDYVDSQNSFGATIRTNYSIVMIYSRKEEVFYYRDFTVY